MKYFWIFLTSLLVSLIIMPLRGGYVNILGLSGFPLTLFLYFIMYFVFSAYIFRKCSKDLKIWGIFLVLFIGAFHIEPFRRITHFESTLISLPDAVFRVLGILAGWGYYKLRNIKGKVLLILCSLALCLWMSYFGFPLWMEKVCPNKPYTENVDNEVIKKPFVFRNKAGNDLNVKDFRNKYLILYFWNPKSKVCYDYFPKFQELCQRYQNNEDIELLSVFCYHKSWGDSWDTGSKVLDEKGYTFPSASIDGENPVLKHTGADFFKVLILNKEGEIIFRGAIENVSKTIDAAIGHKEME